MSTEDTKKLCARCDHRHPSRGVPGAHLADGTYSPSSFCVLSSGELECSECEGAGYHWEEETQSERDCGSCKDGSVPCEHEGQETYSEDDIGGQIRRGFRPTHQAPKVQQLIDDVGEGMEHFGLNSFDMEGF